jgi:hypothetical protein
MLEKVIQSDAQEELVKQAGQLIQVFEAYRHIKCAASGMFSRKDLEAHAPPRGKFLTHIITMGSAEQYGPNRNNDLWSDKELQRKHATFVTHGKNYREHRNKDPKLAIGDIIAEKYDKKLQRGEILMHSDMEKAAAEFEKARKGEPLSGSMAANVDHDVCTTCGFKSYRPSQRCACIKNLMDNVDPTFKDYSYVERPADRIAHYLNYLIPHDKAASIDPAARPMLRGDELASMYGMNQSAYLPYLRKIASWDQPQEEPAKRAAATSLLPHAFEGQFDPRVLEKMASHAHPSRVLRSLINRQMILPLASFHSFVTGTPLSKSASDPVVQEAANKMAGIRIIIARGLEGGGGPTGDGSLFDEAADQFQPSSCGCEDIVDGLLDKAQDQFALRYEALAKRAMRNEAAPVVVGDITPPSREALSLGTLYQAYLCKTSSYLGDDWIIPAQLSVLR